MMRITAEQSRELQGAADAVYAVLADYHEGHPAILPKSFTHLHVEQGGRGAGTVIRFGMKMGGRVREVRAAVSEPEPGRILEERILDTRGMVTRFIVDPVESGRVRVTISTSWSAPGLRGVVERLMVPPVLRRIYREQLANLERIAGVDGHRNAGGTP
jgi:hypothetical protein